MSKDLQNIRFYKFSASANDFIVIDNRTGDYSDRASELAQRMCKRRYSVGADGLIFIEASDNASFRVRFFNPDGNEFNTCGNGGRCAARFAALFSVAPQRMKIQTNIGVIDAEVLGNQVNLKFVPPRQIKLNQVITVQGREFKGHVVHLGEPHFVSHAKSLREIDFVPVARALRYHEVFGREGSNVHFIEPLSRNRLKIRSYERGVEDETLACGSGCVSAAVSTFSNKETDPPITFEPQSGISVSVLFSPENHFKDLYLQGDARLVYHGELSEEALTGFPVK